MPKKVVTKQSSSNQHDLAERFKNMCDALAESMGTTATVDTTSAKYSASISMESVGYPELTIQITSGDSTEQIIGKIKNSNTGMTVKLTGQTQYWSITYQYYPTYNAYTAVCARDSNNDSVVATVTWGRDPSKSEAYQSNSAPPIVFFAGRDTNDNVLFGGGTNGHVSALCCGKNTATSPLEQTVRYPDVVTNVLHLTKMINYLADGYPEMKSAYVTVTRPFKQDPGKEYKNQSYYAGGALWFIGGDPERTIGLYRPMDPVIKY